MTNEEEIFEISSKIKAGSDFTNEEIDAQIAILKAKRDNAKTLDQAIKIFINAGYGALANEHFLFYNPYIAEAVTLQGQDLINKTSNVFEKYIHDTWHDDTELHKKLGITETVKPISKDLPGTIYMDTDSVDKNTTIQLVDQIKIKSTYKDTITSEPTISNFFNYLYEDNEMIFKNDREFFDLRTKDIRIKNVDFDSKEIIESKINSVFRHRVFFKERWLIRSVDKEDIYVTDDHSVMVVRNRKLIETKASMIEPETDLLVIIINGYIYLKKILIVELAGFFHDEYVYDIEVADENRRTFIGNNILVHNSCFFNIGDMIDSSNFKGDPVQFMLDFNDYRLQPFFDKWHTVYAKRTNTENVQEFEFEKFSHNALWLAKKTYALNLAYKDGILYDKGTKIDIKGMKIVRGESSPFSKEKQKIFLDYIFDTEGKVEYNDIIAMVNSWKKEFEKSDINKIARLTGITDYQKYTISDSKGSPLQLASGCPVHNRAAANYNYFLNCHPEYKKKYEMIKSKAKVKWYYCKNDKNFYDGVFGFIPNEFPYAFAPEVDYKKMFTDTCINPINIFLKAMKLQLIPENLVRVKKLF